MQKYQFYSILKLIYQRFYFLSFMFTFTKNTISMRYLYFIITVITLSLTSCRDDFSFEASTGGLEFSKDTVYLDTVFTNIGSSTYRLKVYNRSDNDIFIPKIQLNKGVNSKYRIMVDGMTGDNGATGKIFSNVELMAKDSLFIFIEVTADVASANPTDFLYTDKIDFVHGNGEVQKVELVTLIQDAYFIYPHRTQNADNTYTYENIDLDGDGDFDEQIIGSTLDHADAINGNEYYWNNTKPYVIYGNALVPDNETLTVQSGARVHFHANSGLIIAKNGKIIINGENPPANSETDETKEVIFEGDRLEPGFSNVPGQWSAIINFSNRNDNLINHLTVKNAVVGILSMPLNVNDATDIPKLNINNSKIVNCSNVGLLARRSTINGNNVVINNCGIASLACTYGGNYSFTHSTFNNNWNSSKQVAVVLNDYYETEDALYINNPTLNYNFTNCIVYGSNQNELFIEKKGANTLNYAFNNCLIKQNNTNSNPLYPPTNTSNFNSGCKIATNSTEYNPKLKNVALHKLWPTENLDAVITPAPTGLNSDIFGKPRTNIGAYQFIAN